MGADGMKLEARNVSFSYTRPVLADITLGLRPGQVVGLIGPNGCGKTTVLRVLDGILRPAQGDVLIDGSVPLRRLRRKEIARRIAMVPQNGGSHDYERVFGFAMRGRSPHLSLLGFETEKDEEIVREALAKTRMTEYIDARVTEISGGERQRLLLARALAQESEVLLLDEFTANLDINYQVELMRLVCSVTRARNLATLVVSHEINLLAGFCDRLVLVKDGTIRGDGPVRDVVTRDNLRALFGLDFVIRKSESGPPEVSPVIDEGKES